MPLVILHVGVTHRGITLVVDNALDAGALLPCCIASEQVNAILSHLQSHLQSGEYHRQGCCSKQTPVRILWLRCLVLVGTQLPLSCHMIQCFQSLFWEGHDHDVGTNLMLCQHVVLWDITYHTDVF